MVFYDFQHHKFRFYWPLDGVDSVMKDEMLIKRSEPFPPPVHQPLDDSAHCSDSSMLIQSEPQK